MTTERPLVRDAAESDKTVLYQMLCELEGQVINYEDFCRVYQRNRSSDYIFYFVAEVKSVVVGMISCHIQGLLHHAGLVAEIQEMYVLPPYRSHGIGKMLMQHVIEAVETLGVSQIEVTSRAHRIDAHRFYEREGFEKSHVKLVRYFTST